eukprot:scaffold63949_cov20-Tisochrysis_lutea.AAC.2
MHKGGRCRACRPGWPLLSNFGRVMNLTCVCTCMRVQVNAQRRKVQDLQARLASTQRTIATMGRLLPDGGSKVRTGRKAETSGWIDR